MLFVIVGVLVVVSVLGAAHHYLWRRLVRDPSTPGGWWRRAGTVLVCFLPLLSVATVVSSRMDVPFSVQRFLAWPGYLWLPLLLYLLLALAVSEPLRWLLNRRARSARSAAGADVTREPTQEEAAARVGSEPDRDGAARTAEDAAPGEHAPGEPAPGGYSPAVLARRRLIARGIALGAGAAAAATVGGGAWEVLHGPKLKRVTVPLTKLPRAAHGYRIAVVSDLHLGPVLGRAHTQRTVDLINSSQPDLVAVVGDLADGTVSDLGPAAEPLRYLRSRHGSFFVTGNHEYFGDPRSWIRYLRSLGVHPLENARRELPHFELAGVNDVQGEASGEGPDFGKALGDRDPGRATVLLAHQPVQVHEAARHGVDLQLSGHTHGGQLWPGPYLAALANPTVAGLDRYDGTQLYVSRGAGAWGPPVRVGAEPDVTVVELASRQA